MVDGWQCRTHEGLDNRQQPRASRCPESPGSGLHRCQGADNDVGFYVPYSQGAWLIAYREHGLGAKIQAPAELELEEPAREPSRPGATLCRLWWPI